MKTLHPEFIPARPTKWFIATAQAMVRAELAVSNRLTLHGDSIEIFKKIPAGAGVILASNHADETDPLVCLELSRLSGKRFITMCNREAFDEIYGLAGMALQRLGLFSVKRGAHDGDAKNYAIQTVRQGKDILVIFPEGEIYYLNDVVQPFHSGAVEICMQAIVENRKANVDWTAFILPMVIKYHYGPKIGLELEKRIAKMEAHLMRKPEGDTLQSRLLAIQGVLLDREKQSHSLQMEPASPLNLTQQLMAVRTEILADVEQRHSDLPVSPHARKIDQAWQLEAEIRQSLEEQIEESKRAELQTDLASLKEVAQLTSWRPSYFKESASTDRLAEAVLKTERELYRIKRPRQLTMRKVFVRLAEPIDLGQYVADYIEDSQKIRHGLTQQLHEQIQSLIDATITNTDAIL